MPLRVSCAWPRVHFDLEYRLSKQEEWTYGSCMFWVHRHWSVFFCFWVATWLEFKSECFGSCFGEYRTPLCNLTVLQFLTKLFNGPWPTTLLVYADQKKDNWKSTQQQAKKAILLVETPLAESNVFLLGCALFPSKISCDPNNSKLTRAGLICHGFSRKRHKTVADSLCLLLIPQKETKQPDNNSWPVIPLFSVSYTLHAFVLSLSLTVTKCPWDPCSIWKEWWRERRIAPATFFGFPDVTKATQFHCDMS